MDKSLLNPIGPLGSILIGIAFIVLHYTNVMSLGWLGAAFVFGGIILLMVRIMNNKQQQLPK
ncbi:MAG: hypothetical protein ACPG4Q_16060 [Phycisphaeraceae bacterium]